MEIVAPFWANDGNWIDLSKLTQTTFESMFGVTIEGADFDKVVVVDKAGAVNTDDEGNRLQIRDSIDATDAAMLVTDTDGDVVDSMIYSGVPSGDSVLVPTGSMHHVVVTSNTGNAKIRKWDSSAVDLSGATSWLDWFGIEFGSRSFVDARKSVPVIGVSIHFTIPDTTDVVTVGFSSVEISSVVGTRFGTISTTAFDWDAEPSHTWGISGGITGGINFPGHDIDLIPGQTYFFNVRNNNGQVDDIRLRSSYIVA